MSRNHADLEQALVALADGIDNAVRRALAMAKIKSYCLIMDAILALSDKTISSYSVGGRSVSKADIGALRSEAKQYETELEQLLGCSLGSSNGSICIDHSYGGEIEL